MMYLKLGAKQNFPKMFTFFINVLLHENIKSG